MTILNVQCRRTDDVARCVEACHVLTRFSALAAILKPIPARLIDYPTVAPARVQRPSGFGYKQIQSNRTGLLQEISRTARIDVGA